MRCSPSCATARRSAASASATPLAATAPAPLPPLPRSPPSGPSPSGPQLDGSWSGCSVGSATRANASSAWRSGDVAGSASAGSSRVGRAGVSGSQLSASSARLSKASSSARRVGGASGSITPSSSSLSICASKRSAVLRTAVGLSRLITLSSPDSSLSSAKISSRLALWRESSPSSLETSVRSSEIIAGGRLRRQERSAREGFSARGVGDGNEKPSGGFSSREPRAVRSATVRGTFFTASFLGMSDDPAFQQVSQQARGGGVMND